VRSPFSRSPDPCGKGVAPNDAGAKGSPAERVRKSRVGGFALLASNLVCRLAEPAQTHEQALSARSKQLPGWRDLEDSWGRSTCADHRPKTSAYPFWMIDPTRCGLLG
jgi:hypothetical protein